MAKSAILLINKADNTTGYFVELFEYDKPSPPVDESVLRSKQSTTDINISRVAGDLTSFKALISAWLDTF